ncbi:hypothetical protein HN262_15610 [Acinetobacter baumannii]|nr:hypothetical protein [Acinetobacter baumannii]
MLISFFLIMILTAILFWFYLNIQASVVVSAHESDIRLPESLETKIHVGNNLQVQSIGKLDTSIDIDRQISVPLKGRYLADLEFEVALLHKDLKCKAPLIEPNLRRNLGKWST